MLGIDDGFWVVGDGVGWLAKRVKKGLHGWYSTLTALLQHSYSTYKGSIKGVKEFFLSWKLGVGSWEF